MFGLQPVHLIIILVIALLLFAPSRFPDLVRNVGKAIMEFRRAIHERPTETGGKPTQSPAAVSKEESSNNLRKQ